MYLRIPKKVYDEIKMELTVPHEVHEIPKIQEVEIYISNILEPNQPMSVIERIENISHFLDSFSESTRKYYLRKAGYENAMEKDADGDGVADVLQEEPEKVRAYTKHVADDKVMMPGAAAKAMLLGQDTYTVEEREI